MYVSATFFCLSTRIKVVDCTNLQLSHDVVKLFFVKNLTDPEEIGLWQYEQENEFRLTNNSLIKDK